MFSKHHSFCPAAFVIAVLVVSTAYSTPISILEYGAVANDTSYNASYINGKALFYAVNAANNANASDREVIVPSGYVFSFLPFGIFTGIHNVVVRIDGVLSAFAGDNLLWPNMTDGRTFNIIEFDNSDQVTLTGQGSIVGNGYHWWWYVVLTGLDNRPHMIVTQSVTNFILENLTLLNSPQYHVFLRDNVNATVQFLTVHVDVTEQQSLLESFGLFEDGLPMFPLNTDGIDIAGENITVRHCSVQNFDDSVCIKPANKNYNLTTCSQNMHIHDIFIHLGVGASVGSVPPDPAVNCIRNILFERIHFDHPIKALYVKPNPCPDPERDGTGIVDSITYKDIFADTPLWWPIWVSTQQQHQPGNGADTGCSFFYPLPNTTCPTQGCVPVTRLTIKNFTANGALLSPGVLRCNETNPCRDFYFEDVNIQTDTGFPFGVNYLCHAIENFTIVGASSPLQCVYNASSEDDDIPVALKHPMVRRALNSRKFP
ncbi:glycoside hydrolase family 28, putative [Bodo saltans]|uniref:Glycoside hydrolase family 28, putative n=1 Tax=Bodo saltans TaxID=75058 RepID=A0A0S4J4U7_BODSA|nr:glycoside hydrolase family 28, putative [Bodo saltans]|eukprot:CUG78731.1 glycoside hydrolase family 28, putative [Bodo saltans]